MAVLTQAVVTVSHCNVDTVNNVLRVSLESKVRALTNLLRHIAIRNAVI